jgi:hypothetical protein
VQVVTGPLPRVARRGNVLAQPKRGTILDR